MYQKIINLITKNNDKVYHFLAGMIICLLFQIFFPLWLSLGVTFLFGLAKEIRDQVVYKGFDWVDWAVTIAGGLFAAICLII